jgi:hypothetical protein
LVLNATIINHTAPAVSVVVADNVGNVTYNQLRNSLGNQVYDVQGLYLYSQNASQLIGIINYNIYQSTGDKDVTNIVTTVDPYQFSGSIIVDLKDKVNSPIILNGQSSVSTAILPNTYLQIKFLAERTTNSFGMNLQNFNEMQKITNTKFFENYGETSLQEIIDNGKLSTENVGIPVAEIIEEESKEKVEQKVEVSKKGNYNNSAFLVGIALIFSYIIYKSVKTKNI